MISITLPSVRPDALARTLANLDQATVGRFEVVVVSPFAPRVDQWSGRGQLVWVEEKTPLGCNGAHAAALKATAGELVMPWVDDHLLIYGWDAIARAEYERLETARERPLVLGLRHADEPHVGTVFGLYYPYFPLMRHAYAVDGGWFSSEYRFGFADADVALRAWAAGGRCEWTSVGLVIRHDDDRRKLPELMDGEAQCAPEDMKRFTDRWALRYGSGWDTSRLRGFNVDVCPERSKFPERLTINCNDPAAFAAAARP